MNGTANGTAANGETNGHGKGIVQFDVDQPLIVALKYPQGKEFTTKQGVRYLFTTATGEALFVNPPDAERIHALNVREGEPIEIVARRRTDGQKGVEYFPRRLNPAPTAAPGPRPPAPQPAPARPEEAQPQPAAQADRNIMTVAMLRAIDAVIAGETYAAERGRPLKFSEREVQALATSIYISATGGNRK